MPAQFPMIKLHDTPMVTVGVASFNNAAYICETLDSIRQQDYSNWELIVVDDCSSDNSVELIRQWLDENPEVVGHLIVHEQNRGVSCALNGILREAKGEFISTIGSDDLYQPNKLSSQVRALQELSAEYAMCYGEIVLIDSNGDCLNKGQPVISPQGHPEGNILKDLLRGNFIPAMGQLTRTAACREVGGFDEQLVVEDWDMWLRLARLYKVKYTPGIVAKYRIHGRSAMATRAQALLESCLLLVSKHLGVSVAADEVAHAKLAGLACELYVLGGPTAGMWLERTWKWKPSGRSTLYAVMAKAGISYPQAVGMWRKMRGLLGVSKKHVAV